jgi:hypothetical protein
MGEREPGEVVVRKGDRDALVWRKRKGDSDEDWQGPEESAEATNSSPGRTLSATPVRQFLASD